MVATPLPAALPAIAPEVLGARGQIVEEGPGTAFFDNPGDVVGDARRAVYRSVSGVDGSPRTVSGAFFLPHGTPPPGGWPVVSMAHGTTGIDPGCGPSLDHTLAGYLPAVTSYLSEGYAVAMTDYEGLGTDGRHPYLEPRTAAFNVTDAVRALANLFPGVSNRWVAFGNSQGGQAAWAAGELTGWYGAGLDMVGSVALSPAANLTPLADLVRDGSLSGDQRAALPMAVAGITRYEPDLRTEQLRAGVAPAELDRSFGCPPDGGGPLVSSVAHKGVSDALREALRRIALPQQRLAVPLLVINGLGDTTIYPQWVGFAVEQACALGGRIEHLEVKDAGHGDLGGPAYAAASDWVRDRFAAGQAPSNCGAAPTVLP